MLRLNVAAKMKLEMPKQIKCMTEAEAIKTLQNFLQIADVLEEDYRLARAQCKQAPGEYSKRVLIKAIFAFFEGHLYAFKQVVLTFENLKNLIPNAKESQIAPFTEEERANLEGFTLRTSSDGEVRKHRLAFKEDMKSVMQIFYRAIQQRNEADFSEGWTQLMDAQKIRDRITHPKIAEALKISDKEMETAIAGHDWYRETNSRMLKSLRESPLGLRFQKMQ